MSYRADKLVIDARTDTHIDRQTQATTIPEGQNWPRVKRKRYHKIKENSHAVRGSRAISWDPLVRDNYTGEDKLQLFPNKQISAII